MHNQTHRESILELIKLKKGFFKHFVKVIQRKLLTYYWGYKIFANCKENAAVTVLSVPYQKGALSQYSSKSPY